MTEYNFLKACWCQPVDRVPVWLMRQAGRYLQCYKDVRAKGGGTFLDLCKDPARAAEVTIQPIDILDADAAILFSDILTPIEPMGMKLDFVPGPVFEDPVRTAADVDALIVPEDMAEAVSYVPDIIKRLRRAFEGRVPLIGFGGAPFTLACYMVEGKGSKDFASLKQMMYSDFPLYDALMTKVTEMDRRYLNMQIEAGAQAIQIFDTWGGLLAPHDFERYILPYVKTLIDGLNREGVPIIYFVKNGGTMLELVKEAGADVLGLDWHVNLGKRAIFSGLMSPFRAISTRLFFTHPKITLKKRCSGYSMKMLIGPDLSSILAMVFCRRCRRKMPFTWLSAFTD